MMLLVVPPVITSADAQNGQLSDVMFGFSVVDAPQLAHFTVVMSCFSTSLLFSFRNFSKSISSTIVTSAASVISFSQPQYSHFKCCVPGAYFSRAPHSRQSSWLLTSFVFSNVSIVDVCCMLVVSPRLHCRWRRWRNIHE